MFMNSKQHYNMHRIAILMQTCLTDKEMSLNLFRSIRENNVDNIPVYVSTHNGEQEVFSAEMPSVQGVFEDGRVFDSLLVDRQLRLPSTRLNIHKISLAENWIIFPSATEVIHPFRSAQFFNEAGNLNYYVAGPLDQSKYYQFLIRFDLPVPTHLCRPDIKVWNSSVLSVLGGRLASQWLTTDKLIAFADSRGIRDIDSVLYSSVHEYYLPYADIVTTDPMEAP